MVTPPSITIFCPVIKAPASDAKSTAAPATSSGIPIRLSGALASISDKTLGSSHKALAKSVLIKPGHNALTVIFLGPHSVARDLTSPRSAVLEIE